MSEWIVEKVSEPARALEGSVCMRKDARGSRIGEVFVLKSRVLHDTLLMLRRRRRMKSGPSRFPRR